MLSGTMFFCGGGVNAARVSDTASRLEYVCFPSAITAWLRNMDVEDWECAEMISVGGQTSFKFSRKGWSGRIVLPTDAALFSERIFLNIFYEFDTAQPGKELTIDNIIIDGQEDEIRSMSFCCEYGGDLFNVEFSYPTRMLQLSSNTIGGIKRFRLSEDTYSLKQVFSLGISIVMDYILN